MESLRWILLVVGIAFVITIYFFGRYRRQRNHSTMDGLGDDLASNYGNDFPEFSAQNLDDVDEGVGQVRVVTRATSESDEENDFSALNISASDKQQVESSATNAVSDIIVLYILPKPDRFLAGSQINSSAQAMGLIFGEMNVFHYMNDKMDNKRSVFSLANMLEPGSFDAENIHELKTTGLTVFMQVQTGDPLDDLTEMLQRSYQLAGLLDARLCNHKREPLTEQHAEGYRTQVSEFVAAKVAAEKNVEVASET
ncbi:hypothetical protein MNBD_GAMMA06-1258 [hydrothermal vent metagenome]|uniref:ZipA C-terminal FtsZ-binding domain-containing protein n=1 Tax=hydrothermal vent metagenome TaxID=652676 RepID=A0A3B0WIH8_9ZZZZ